jgi:ERCC4-related helicase
MQFRDTAQAIIKKLSEKEGIRAAVFIGQAKKKGQGLSQKEQKEVIENFKSGKIYVSFKYFTFIHFNVKVVIFILLIT